MLLKDMKTPALHNVLKDTGFAFWFKQIRKNYGIGSIVLIVYTKLEARFGVDT